MVRVRADAKRRETPNEGGDTPNPPPRREILGGETPNPTYPPSRREIGGETPNPPSRREIRGGETPNPPSQREIVGGETPNPPSQRGSKRKTQNEGGETSNPPPPQKETRGGETSNPSSQREMGGGETSNFPSSSEIGGGETTGRNEIGVTIDPDLLDCYICTNPLCPPLFQCINGHIACNSCWHKVQYNCPSCDKPIGGQNIALEKVLESIHLPCTYANLGCRKSVCYSQMQVHTDTCEFGPSLCPIPGCDHKAFSGDWREHFIYDHRYHGSNYSYGQSCALRFDEVDPYYILFGPRKDLFLLVKEPIPNDGNALSIYYIDLPHRGQQVFPFKLEVWTRENCITSSKQWNSQAVSIKEWKRGKVPASYRLEPLGCPESQMKVNVLINKKRDVYSSD